MRDFVVAEAVLYHHLSLKKKRWRVIQKKKRNARLCGSRRRSLSSPVIKKKTRWRVIQKKKRGMRDFVVAEGVLFHHLAYTF